MVWFAARRSSAGPDARPRRRSEMSITSTPPVARCGAMRRWRRALAAMNVRAALAAITAAVAAVAPMAAMPEQVKRHEGETREDPYPVLRKPSHDVSPRC